MRFDKAGYVVFEKDGKELLWALPCFPIHGADVPLSLPESVKTEEENGHITAKVVYKINDEVRLLVHLIEYTGTPFCRLRYQLLGEGRFQTTDGEKPIEYGGIRAGAKELTEVQLSNFDRINYAFKPSVERFSDGLQEDRCFVGPIIVAKYDEYSALVAYEHGAEAPDHFLHFENSDKGLVLYSDKGNYFRGQRFEEYLSPWFEVGIGESEDALRTAYRAFLLHDMSAYPHTREPNIYYNTWNNQERDKYFDHKPYLTAMNQEHMLKEIDVAHEMGIEYFVLDTGWYQKTGDWEVNLERFPDGLAAIREKLEGYGMKLGLWFNPIVAAKTSKPYLEHPEWTMMKDGKEHFCGSIWETEESYGMCLCSDYADYFIDKLVELHDTLGVSYFKWDAVDQYGCDCPHHKHGDISNTRQERLDAYAYNMGLQMVWIASEVTRRCPGVIVDFDITEGGRFVGLGFLSAGKYYLINNGPYFSTFDIPSSVSMEPDTINVFFYAGAARPQVCRVSTQFDEWIPSTLFLTHFLPEGDEKAMRNSMASLVLGGNGLWSDLLSLDKECKEAWSKFLGLYKQVRRDMMEAQPIRRGFAGSSPEIHEKVLAKSGRGAVCFFCRTGGTFTHVTRKLEKIPEAVVGADSFRMRKDGRMEITVTLQRDDARTVFLL